MNLIAGIDPGKDGGFVSLNKDGTIVEACPLAEALERLCKLSSIFSLYSHIFIEKAQVMNKSRQTGNNIRPSAVAMFSYGTGFGEILGIVRALKVPHTLVRPADWTREMHRGTKGTTAEKQRSFEAARRLFPNQDWKVKGRKGPHDGICEAALIAEYGRRCLGHAGHLKQPYDATSWDEL